MFIRRTQTRSSRSGEAYCTFRLVRSERVGPKVRQRTLLNLGRHFQVVGQSAWPVLCRRIDEVLTGSAPTRPRLPPGNSKRTPSASPPNSSPASAPAPPRRPTNTISRRVDVDSLELVRPRSVGVEHVALWAMDQLGLRTLFEELGIGCVAARSGHRLHCRAYGASGLRARHPALAR